MSTLSVTNPSFTPNSTISSSAVNQNFTDIVNWANGNITDTNIGTLVGPLSWTVSSNVLAQSMSTSSTAGLISGALNGVLASNTSGISYTSTAAHINSGGALLNLALSSASSVIPVIKSANAGTGDGVSITDTGTPTAGKVAFKVTSTTKGSFPSPSMTTTQRDALPSPIAGTSIYNSTTKQHESYDSFSSLWTGKLQTVTPLLMLVGSLKADGTTDSGCIGIGTAAKTGTGNYAITFTTAFASKPDVFGTAITGGSGIVNVTARSTTGCSFEIIDSGGAVLDAAFSFLIIGPTV